LPGKTDASNPADWLWMASADMDVVRVAATQQVGFTACRSKLAEVVEKAMKAELIRLGWPLERTHDLEHLLDELAARGSDLVPSLKPLCEALASSQDHAESNLPAEFTDLRTRGIQSDTGAFWFSDRTPCRTPQVTP
jgi:HEPN domain-containing protein